MEEIKTGKRTFKGNISNSVSILSKANSLSASDKILLIRGGLSKNQLEDIKLSANLDYDTLTSILSVSRAKLLNKKGAEKFDHLTSERIMLLAELISFGQEVFGDKNLFNRWIRKKSVAFGDKAPLELMDTVYGIEEVKKELGRIEHGIF